MLQMVRQCASCKALLGLRRHTETRLLLRWRGSRRAQNGFTSSTSMPRSVVVRTVNASLRAALATGCRRVNIGTAALENPEWCARAIAEFGDRIAVGLDVRGTTLAARGWTEEGGDIWEVLERLEREGCPRYVVTDVTKDGTLQGPNLGLLRQMCERTNRPVIASGGVSSLEDLRAIASLVDIGVEGAIVGKALYAQAFTLEEALDLMQECRTSL